MVSPKPNPDGQQENKKKPTKRKRGKEKSVPVQQNMGVVDPRIPHPRDIDQPTDHHFNMKDLGQKKEGENFDKFDVNAEIRRRGGATCDSVLIMKHSEPLPMWFDEFLCPRVMPGKWCGYVAYAFRRRIRFGSWPTWLDVPDEVKDEAWADILASWEFRTRLTEDEHAELRKLWTTYASDRMRNWRTVVSRRYIWKPKKGVGHPCSKYRWMNPKEWDLFVAYRSTEEFLKLRNLGIKNAELKEYEHTSGSGGYRRIILKKGSEKREEEIKKRMAKGMTGKQAEASVAKMKFRVDRSVVFVEGNRSRKTGQLRQDFVRRLEPQIMELNKEVDEGRLVVDGKEDILIQVTKKPDHGGRYRGCPGTAKLHQAKPDYYAAKMRKKHSYRSRKSPASPSRKDGMKVDVETLDYYTVWLTTKLGIQTPIHITPQEFLSEQQGPMKATMPDKDDSGDPTDEDPIPCYLNIQDSCGSIKRVASGVVITRPQNVPPQPGSLYVQVRPPILLPDARLPYYDLNLKTVGGAVGAAINWPEEFIDFEGSMQTPKEKPKKKFAAQTSSESEGENDIRSEEESEERTEEGSEDGSEEGSVHSSEEGSEEGSNKTDESESNHSQLHEQDDAEKKETQSLDQSEGPRVETSNATGKPKDAEFRIPVIDAALCTPTTNVNWEFAHHVQEPSIRKDFLAFLQEMRGHPHGRDVYEIQIYPEVFGNAYQSINLVIAEAMSWIISCNTYKKAWIRSWQMDIWASHVHSQLPKEDRGRVQIISTNLSFSGYTKPNEGKTKFVNGLISIMEERPARLYVMPSCRDDHWMMFLILPEDSVIYCIDSNGNGIATKKKFEYDMFMRLGATYDSQIRTKGTSSEDPKEWRIVNIKHKHQPYFWECGYYCMFYMEKILLGHSGVDVQKLFPQDFDAYPAPLLEGLIDSFCRYVLQTIAPQCRAKNT